MNTRVLTLNDWPDISRLIVENATLQGAPVTGRLQQAIKHGVFERLMGGKADFYGCDLEGQLVAWCYYKRWNPVDREATATIGSNYATNSRPLPKCAGSRWSQPVIAANNLAIQSQRDKGVREFYVLVNATVEWVSQADEPTSLLHGMLSSVEEEVPANTLATEFRHVLYVGNINPLPYPTKIVRLYPREP